MPFVSLPKLTIPLTSAMIAESLGLRASNKSATRGKPPVISRVFDVSCGIRATTSPRPTAAPSSKLTIASSGKKNCAGKSVLGKKRSFPFSSTNFNMGFKSRPPGPRCLAAVITRLLSPVISSVCRFTVTPSIISINFTRPSTSVIIG